MKLSEVCNWQFCSRGAVGYRKWQGVLNFFCRRHQRWFDKGTLVHRPRPSRAGVETLD